MCQDVSTGSTLHTHIPTRKFTPDIIHAAIDGLQIQKQRIDDQIAELRQILNPARLLTPLPRPHQPSASAD